MVIRRVGVRAALLRFDATDRKASLLAHVGQGEGGDVFGEEERGGLEVGAEVAGSPRRCSQFRHPLPFLEANFSRPKRTPMKHTPPQMP